MNIQIDAKGKQCPLPVIEAKNAISGMTEAGIVEVTVDNEIAVQNLTKMADHKGLKAKSEKKSDQEYTVWMEVTEEFVKNNIKDGNVSSTPVTGENCIPDIRKKKTVVVLGADHMGEGDDKLGKMLMKGFVYALTQLEELPQTILLFNSGAYLSCEGSDSVEDLKSMEAQGVEVMTNMVIGRVLSIDELFEMGYKAVFVGSGAGLPMFMHIPGEALKGVYSANEYLTRTNLMKAYTEEADTPIIRSKAVAVVGGGNVAMDAARSALRLGAESVYIVYRRGMAELPARKEEVEHAEEEGIIFKTLCNPVEILSDEDGFVKAITCIEMELGEPDASGRRRPIEKKGSEFTMDVDTVIMSLGTSPNPLIRSTTPGLETNKHGCIVTEGDEGKTSRDGVYAGGDAVTGAATVIKAMGAGKAAAKAMDKYIRNK